MHSFRSSPRHDLIAWDAAERNPLNRVTEDCVRFLLAYSRSARTMARFESRAVIPRNREALPHNELAAFPSVRRIRSRGLGLASSFSTDDARSPRDGGIAIRSSQIH